MEERWEGQEWWKAVRYMALELQQEWLAAQVEGATSGSDNSVSDKGEDEVREVGVEKG